MVAQDGFKVRKSAGKIYWSAGQLVVTERLARNLLIMNVRGCNSASGVRFALSRKLNLAALHGLVRSKTVQVKID